MTSEPATVASSPARPVDPPSPPPALPLPAEPALALPNGFPSPDASRLPQKVRWSKRTRLLLGSLGGSVLLVLLIAGPVLLSQNSYHKARPDLVLHNVKYDRLELTILERGSLESANNGEVICRVKSGSRNSTVATTIKWVVEDGTEVKGPRPGPLHVVATVSGLLAPSGQLWNTLGAMEVSETTCRHTDVSTGSPGDLIVALDDSGWQEQLKMQKITLDKAEGDKIMTEENHKITVSQNDFDIKSKETKLQLATIALMKFTGLSREKVLEPDTLTRIKQELSEAAHNTTRPAMDIANEDLARYKSGDFLQLVKDALGKIEMAQSDLSQQEDREAWSLRMVKKRYQTASQAQAETSRRESYQLSLNQATLALDVLVKYTKIQTLTTNLRVLEEAQLELEQVKIQALCKEIRDRTNRESMRSVWETQQKNYQEVLDEIKKCNIYAPQDGMVVYFIPEQARYGGGSQQSIIAQGEPVREGQKLMQIPDLKHMLVNTKVHEALVSRVHADQPATIRVESFPDRVLHGHVESVATLSAQQDWLSADVKVYVTKVAINPEDIEDLNLKPGMSAEVTIEVSDALENVLTVPVQAVVGGSEMGSQRKIFVMTPEGPQERLILVGLSNDKYVEIRDGLQEGDEVVLNPRSLAGEGVKVRERGAERGASVRGGFGAPRTKGIPHDHAGGSDRPGPPGKGASEPASGGGERPQADERPKRGWK